MRVLQSDFLPELKKAPVSPNLPVQEVEKQSSDPSSPSRTQMDRFLSVIYFALFSLKFQKIPMI